MEQIKPGIYMLQMNNKEEKTFEGEIPLKNGMSYNAYLIKDDKTALLNTVDSSVSAGFMNEIKATLEGKGLDYLVIQHMEPDHAYMIGEVISEYPQVQLVATAMAYKMLGQFFPDIKINKVPLLIKEGQVLDLGTHKLTFLLAPMVHWPEVSGVYESSQKVFFSADAFGTFGTFEELDSSLAENPKEEERRYYTNIVGKFGPQVLALLKKASAFEIEVIASLHGPLHTKRIKEVIAEYMTWGSYGKEDEGVLILCASIYGNTLKAAESFKEIEEKQGIKCELLDLDKTDVHLSLAKSFQYARIALFASSFNGGVFPPMRNYLSIISEHGLANRRFGIVQNGTWAPCAGKIMYDEVSKLKNTVVVDPKITIISVLSDDNYKELEDLSKFL